MALFINRYSFDFGKTESAKKEGDVYKYEQTSTVYCEVEKKNFDISEISDANSYYTPGECNVRIEGKYTPSKNVEIEVEYPEKDVASAKKHQEFYNKIVSNENIEIMNTGGSIGGREASDYTHNLSVSDGIISFERSVYVASEEGNAEELDSAPKLTYKFLMYEDNKLKATMDLTIIIKMDEDDKSKLRGWHKEAESRREELESETIDNMVYDELYKYVPGSERSKRKIKFQGEIVARDEEAEVCIAYTRKTKVLGKERYVGNPVGLMKCNSEVKDIVEVVGRVYKITSKNNLTVAIIEPESIGLIGRSE